MTIRRATDIDDDLGFAILGGVEANEAPHVVERVGQKEFRGRHYQVPHFDMSAPSSVCFGAPLVAGAFHFAGRPLLIQACALLGSNVQK